MGHDLVIEELVLVGHVHEAVEHHGRAETGGAKHLQTLERGPLGVEDFRHLQTVLKAGACHAFSEPQLAVPSCDDLFHLVRYLSWNAGKGG